MHRDEVRLRGHAAEEPRGLVRAYRELPLLRLRLRSGGEPGRGLIIGRREAIKHDNGEKRFR